MPDEKNIANVRGFYKSYLASPNYKKRLQKQGYINPDQVIKDRLTNVSNVQVKNMPGTTGSAYKTFKGFIAIDKEWDAKHGFKSDPLPHEFSHAAGSIGYTGMGSLLKNLQLNGNDINAIDKRNKAKINEGKPGIDSHDSMAGEYKADMDTLRYRLKQDKIYDTGTQEFNSEFLKKAREKYKTDSNVQRLFKNSKSDADLIYLMNNVASTNKNVESTYAQNGGLIGKSINENPMRQSLYSKYRKNVLAMGGNLGIKMQDLPMGGPSAGAIDSSKFRNNTQASMEGVGSGVQEVIGNMTGMGPIIAAGSAIQTGIADMIGKEDQFGRRNLASSLIAGNAKGGTIGLVSAALGYRKKQKRGDGLEAEYHNSQNSVTRNLTAARVGNDPSLLTGYKGASMFANGGEIGPGKKIRPGSVDVNGSATVGGTGRGWIPTNAGYSWDDNGLGKKSPTWEGTPGKNDEEKKLNTMFQYYINNNPNSNNYESHPERVHYSAEPVGPEQPNDLPTFAAMGGNIGRSMSSYGTKNPETEISAPLAKMFMAGGKAKSLSSNNAIMTGKTHKEGGINIPGMDAEVEEGETTKDNYVFSKRLGFANIHSPIAKAKGIIEKKPPTSERLAAIKRLARREDELASLQDIIKQKLQLS